LGIREQKLLETEEDVMRLDQQAILRIAQLVHEHGATNLREIEVQVCMLMETHSRHHYPILYPACVKYVGFMVFCEADMPISESSLAKLASLKIVRMSQQTGGATPTPVLNF